MTLLIEIPDEIVKHARERSEDSNDEWSAMRTIASGIQIVGVTLNEILEDKLNDTRS